MEHIAEIGGSLPQTFSAELEKKLATKLSSSSSSRKESFMSRASEDQILRQRGYNLTDLLGKGSYAKVYLAEFTGDERDKKAGKRIQAQKLACKVVRADLAPQDFLKKFFPREVEIMSRVNHVHLIRVHSILQRKNKYFLFMQYCENGDVLEFLRTHGAVREKQARIWFCQILRGISYLHERNIAHRDMKCENLLLNHHYNIKISDFGFARYIMPGDDKSMTFCGSVSYAAPEIIRGYPYTPKEADVWSCGVILFVMLNKAMPFSDASLRALYDGQMSRNWSFRSKVKDHVSKEVMEFVYVILDPSIITRPKPEALWDHAWIQNGSNVDISIEPPKSQISRKSIIKRESVLREQFERAKREKELEFKTAKAHIMEADTAKVRHASYFFNNQDRYEGEEAIPAKKSSHISTTVTSTTGVNNGLPINLRSNSN